MKTFKAPAIAIWIIFSLICAWVVSNSQFTADMSAFLPQNPTERQQILIDQISEGVASKALIISIEGVETSVLTQLSSKLAKKLREESHFSSVNNGQGSSSKEDNELLFQNRYLLSPAMSPERMTAEGIRQAIVESLAEISSATGLFSKSLLNQDPTGESLEILKKVVPSTQMNSVGGVWVNGKKNRALLLVQTKAQGADLDGQELAHQNIVASFQAAKSELGQIATQANVKFSGPGVFAVSSRDAIRSEAARLSALGTVLILGLLWLMYRSVTAVFLGMLPVTSGAIAGIAAVGLSFPTVHAMTLGFGVTLIGEAVDYAIYLFVQSKPSIGSSPGVDLIQENAFIQNFWPTVRLGVITSVIGFSTLLFSGFTGLSQLGLFSIVGISTAALVTRYVLPMLMPKNFSIRQPAKLNVVLVKIVAFLSRLKLIAVLITILAMGLLISNKDSLWSSELGGLSPVSQARQNLDEQLRTEIGATDSGVFIIVKVSNSELALEYSEEITARLQGLVNAGVLSGFEAASNYLPSQRLQHARQNSLPETAELKARLQLALKGLPLRADKLEYFISDVNSAKNARLLTRENYLKTSLLLGVDALLMEGAHFPKMWTALIALQPLIKDGTAQTIDRNLIESVLLELPPEIKTATHLIELKTEATNLYKAYLQEAIFLTGLGFLAILVVLALTLRSLPRVFRVIAPLLAAVAIVAAITFQLKDGLTLMHLVGMLLVVAVGSNYALFFDKRTKENRPSNTEGDESNILCSMLFANLTTVVGFGLLAFSSVPVMNAIGSVVGAGTFLALILSAIFAESQTDI